MNNFYHSKGAKGLFHILFEAFEERNVINTICPQRCFPEGKSARTIAIVLTIYWHWNPLYLNRSFKSLFRVSEAKEQKFHSNFGLGMRWNGSFGKIKVHLTCWIVAFNFHYRQSRRRVLSRLTYFDLEVSVVFTFHWVARIHLQHSFFYKFATFLYPCYSSNKNAFRSVLCAKGNHVKRIGGKVSGSRRISFEPTQVVYAILFLRYMDKYSCQNSVLFSFEN